MMLTQEMIDELELLLKFDLSSAQIGLKIHSNAAPAMVAAAGRLHAKGLVDHADGGFLTPLGHEAAEHLQHLRQILSTESSAP